jgi:hypothetical protein
MYTYRCTYVSKYDTYIHSCTHTNTSTQAHTLKNAHAIYTNTYTSGRIEEAIERLEAALKFRPDHEKSIKKLADAKKALDEKVSLSMCLDYTCP